MKKNVKIPDEETGFQKLKIPYKPILRFGYPVVFDDDDDDPDTPANPFPLGDVFWPLALLALMYVCVRAFRRRRA